MAVIFHGASYSGLSGDTKPSSNLTAGDLFVETNTDKIFQWNGSAWDAITVADSAITLAKMAVNSVDSDQYVDGSIDLAHMSDNSVDSDQYVDGSIDTIHIGDNQVTGTKIAMSSDARGDVLVYDGTNYIRLAADNGKFLRSNGTGSNPSWETAGGASINAGTENELVTVANTVTNLEGESELTYDGTDFKLMKGGASATGASLAIETYNDGGNPARLRLRASHNDTQGTMTSNINDYPLGFVQFEGVQSGAFQRSAVIRAETAEAWDANGRGSKMSFYTTPNNTNTETKAMEISHKGQMTKPKQSCGLVRVTSDANNITGDGNLAQITFGTVVEDQNGDWSTSNYNTFYAPVTGNYFFHVVLSLHTGLSTASTEIFVQFATDYSSRTYTVFNQGGLPDGLAVQQYTVGGSAIVKLEEGDYLNVKLRISGDGSNNITVEGGGAHQSALSWCLLA